MGIMEEERDRTNIYETITLNFPKSMSDTKPQIKGEINPSLFTDEMISLRKTCK